MSCLYEELTPREFKEKLKVCPVAYLPLGTLEWHGPHNPLGADGIQSQSFFEKFALLYGGIVLPKLFLGPDRIKKDNDRELYGIDYSNGDEAIVAYEDQMLPGSAYYINDELFDTILLNIAKQLKRAGFKVLVAHGHGPSCWAFIRIKERITKETGIECINLFDFDIDDRLKFQNDHAAANETSIMMVFRNDLVHLEYTDEEKMMAVYGKDPRIYASIQYGEEIIAANIENLKNALDRKLNRI